MYMRSYVITHLLMIVVGCTLEFENVPRGVRALHRKTNSDTTTDPHTNAYRNKMCYTGKYHCSNGCGTVTMSPETHECGIKGFHEYEIILTRYLTKDALGTIIPVASSSVTVGNQYAQASFGYMSSDVCTTVINCMTACANCIKKSNVNRIEVTSVSKCENPTA
jgi:hypothetical protein